MWNVRAGVFHHLNDALAIGGGVFTDRSDLPKGILQGPVNLYGLSVGFQSRTPVRLWDGGDAGLDGDAAARQPRFMYFGTTVALRYAGGFGKVQSLALGIDDVCYEQVPVNFCAFAGPDTRVVQHELSIYLGTSLDF